MSAKKKAGGGKGTAAKAGGGAVRTFRARLERMIDEGSWTCVVAPFSVEEGWGTRARIAVKGTINGFAFRSSLFPRGDGRHSLLVNKQMREGARADAGDEVEVTVEPDLTPRTVETPPDLAKALSRNRAAKAAFEAMSYSHKKEYVEWIASAKKEETRERRIEKAVETLAEKKRLEA